MTLPPAGLPLVGVMADRHQAGVSSPGDEAIALTWKPLNEALRTRWPSYAHFVLYTGVGMDNISIPRLNKPALSYLREAGADLCIPLLAIDIDNTGHQRWTDETYEDFTDRLTLALLQGGPHTQYACYYQTRAGVRFLYLLQRPVEPERAEPLHRGLVELWYQAGIPADRGCWQWNRCFALPFVVRDDEPSWNSNPEYIERFDVLIDPDIIPELGARQSEVAPLGPPIQGGPPADEDVAAYVANGAMLDAQKRLVGRACYPALFQGAPLAEPGARHTTLTRYVAQVVALLFPAGQYTPDFVYALFKDAVDRLDPDEDWSGDLWRLVTYYWRKEEGGKQRRVVELETNAVERLVRGFRFWCTAPEVHQDDSSALNYIGKHAIAVVGNSHYVLGPTGEYDVIGVPLNQIGVRIRELSMEPFIAVEELNSKGVMKPIHPQTLLARHGTILRSVEGTCSPIKAMIHGIDTDAATLVLQLFALRQDLLDGAEFSKEVDLWLHKFGGRNYDLLERWIAFALAFNEGPIAALSISGPPSCGKKLLAAGLGECIDSGVYADDREFGTFQSIILRTPFLVINEGMPRLQKVGKHPADMFRHLVGGDPFVCEEKFKPRMVIRNPLRILFAANNIDVVQMLTAGRDLSPADRRALALRLIHFDVQQDAGSWLQSQGGIRYTGVEGRRWIRGDDGAPSDYIVARHFLWLYKHRNDTTRGSRLLVEGDENSDIVRRMAVRGGTAPDVIEALIGMIESAQTQPGLSIDGARVFVTSSGVVNYHRRVISQHTANRITTSQVSTVLRGLEVLGETLPPARINDRLRWRELNLHLLLERALDDGYPCRRLQELCDIRSHRNRLFTSESKDGP